MSTKKCGKNICCILNSTLAIIETKWDITADLKKLNVPALIIYGRQDDQGESTFYLQKECLKNSKMHIIEKCGHLIWEDQPGEFYRTPMRYLTPQVPKK